MVSWDDDENSDDSLVYSSSSDGGNQKLPTTIHDQDFCGIDQDVAMLCDHGKPAERFVAFEGMNTGRKLLGCAEKAWSLWNEGKGIELADETMNGLFNSDQVLKCTKVGLLCVQENPDDRPLMSQVLMMLAATDTATLPTPKQPGFAARRILMETETSSSKPESSIFNSATVTIIEGR